MESTRLPVIILVRPQMGENIGAAARAMLNFGLTEMRLVDPRDGWPNPRAIAMASGAAGQVLDHARIFPTLAEAMEGIDFAFATTARGRELSKPVHTPATAMDMARAHPGRCAIIFGPEIEKLGDHFEERLGEAGFFFPETKAASMRLNLRNMWSRLALTRGDVRILHGMLRQLTRR